MMRLSEVPPRVQTHRRTLIALARRGSGCWRAHRVSGSAEGAEGGMRGAEGGALKRMGRAARAREGCLGQWEKGCGGVEVGHQCRGRTSGRAPPASRQRRAKSRLAMQLLQGQGRQPLAPEGAPLAARARGVREEILPLSPVRGTPRNSRVLSPLAWRADLCLAPDDLPWSWGEISRCGARPTTS